MKIVLADLLGSVVVAWHQTFADSDHMSVTHGPIFEVDCEALVSPANSFGFMDGGLDLKISEFFGFHRGLN